MKCIVRPELVDFDQEIAKYRHLFDVVNGIQSPVSFTWLRVQAKPVIRVCL